jgi:hypothetical protein
MYKNILSETGELDYLALIALVFFFAFFLYVSWRTIKMSKSEVVYAEELPFSDKKQNKSRG